jgi:hypothetical protein
VYVPLHAVRLHQHGRRSALRADEEVIEVVTNMHEIGRAGSRELAHRVTSDIEVSLLWRQLGDLVTVRLTEVASGLEFEFAVRPEDALDAFIHPYAYLPRPRVDSLDLLAA